PRYTVFPSTTLFRSKLYAEYLLPVCSSLLLTGDKALKTPADLAQHTLLHDASRRDWQTYTRQLGLNHINVQQGPIFSHSAMVLQDRKSTRLNSSHVK